MEIIGEVRVWMSWVLRIIGICTKINDIDIRV